MSIFNDLKRDLLLKEEKEAEMEADKEIIEEGESEEEFLSPEDQADADAKGENYSEETDLYNYNEDVASLLSEESDDPAANGDVPEAEIDDVKSEAGSEDPEGVTDTDDDELAECGDSCGSGDVSFDDIDLEDDDLDLDMDVDDTDATSEGEEPELEEPADDTDDLATEGADNGETPDDDNSMDTPTQVPELQEDSYIMSFLESVDPDDGEEVECDDEEVCDDEDEDDYDYDDDFDLGLDDECGFLTEEEEVYEGIEAKDQCIEEEPDDDPSNTANSQYSKEGAVTDDDLTDEGSATEFDFADFIGEEDDDLGLDDDSDSDDDDDDSDSDDDDDDSDDKDDDDSDDDSDDKDDDSEDEDDD